jgi:hypothetical protein
VLIKLESKSGASISAGVVEDARTALDRNGGLPTPQSLAQFADRLVENGDNDDLGEAVLDLLLANGVRPDCVTDVMFLFAGNDAAELVRHDLASYNGSVCQQSVILSSSNHQQVIRRVYEEALTDDS